MPPPLNFDQLRLGRGGGGGETKEALLARAGAERAVRADARRRLHGAIIIQRVWRGRGDAARARASLLAEWDARFGALRVPPSRLDAEARMLPPILFAGASRAGATRLLRCVALALASVASEDPDVSICATCASDPAWTHRARRLAALALDILETPPSDHQHRPADPSAGALAECALRLVVAMHTPASWRCRREDRDHETETETKPRPKPSAAATAAATAALADPSTPRGATHHARLCAAAAKLASRSDPAAAPLVDVALRAIRPERARSERGGAAEEHGGGAEEEHGVAAEEQRGAECLARNPGFRAACAGLLASPLTHAGLPRDALASLASPVAASACAAALRDVPGDAPEVFAIDNLLGTVTGWRAPQSAPGGSASPGLAAAARVRLARLSDRARFVDAVTSLALAARARPAASRRAAWDLCRAKGAVGCLEEAWFVLGVVGGGPGRIRNRRDDDSTTDEADEETPEDAAALFAAMRLYWALLDEDEDEDDKKDEDEDKSSRTTTTSSSSEREVLAWRRRLRGAAAFAPGALPRVWSLVCRELPTNRSLTDASEGMDTRGAWTAPTLARGAADVPERLVGVLGAFASAHAHLLAVVEDDEFFSRRVGGAVGGGGVRAFTLGEHRAIAACVNTLVVRTHLTRDSGVTARGGASSSSSSSSSSRCFSSESRRARRRLTRACAGLLRALRARDERRAFAPPGLWLAPASNAPLISPAHAAAALAAHLADETRAGTGAGAGDGDGAVRFVRRAAYDSDAALLVDCPHAIPFDHRVRVFRQLVRDDRARAGYAAQSGSVDADEDLGQRARPVAEIVARRGRVLEDAVAQILPLGSAARGRLAVRYVNAAGFEEAGIDAGGLFKELLADACGAGFDPARGVFAATADNLAFPAASAGDSVEGVAILELVGALVGKGLYEGILQETRFAPHFAKYLLGAPRTLDDLASLDPELRRSLALILRHDGDVEDLCLDWTVREERFGAVETHELRPGGADRVVTNDDRLAYVHAVADFHLNRRRRAADAAFARGLARVVRPGWLRLFSAPELSQLMSGAEDADVDIQDLREHARYSGGYTETSRAVVAFWEVVKGFTPEERRALLKFVTSSSRPPVQGFRHLHPPFTIHKVRCEAPSVFSAFAGPDVDRLPSASTCFNVLKLPNYRRTSTMREKIRYAVQSGAGFELS